MPEASARTVSLRAATAVALGAWEAFGTALAFMMPVIALSLPEVVILRKVLKPALIGTVAGSVAARIVAVGYVLNLVM